MQRLLSLPLLLCLALTCCLAQSGTPYSGSPVVLPGRIEAVNFDVGGEGVGYHDSDATNSGGSFRPADAVDIQPCSGCGATGLNVGWVLPGEWLAYTVSFRSAGSFTIATKVASNGAGGDFHFELDGKPISEPTTVPATGGWQGASRSRSPHLTSPRHSRSPQCGPL